MDRHVRAIVSHRLPTAEELEAGCDEWLECCEAYIHRDNCMTTKPQSTTEGLEPCPFCGAAPNLKQVPSKTQSANYWWIGCEIKGTPQKDLIGCGIGHSAWSKDEVIAKWNTRLSPASTAPVVDEGPQKMFPPPAEDKLHIAICNAVQSDQFTASDILRQALLDYQPTQLTRSELIRVQQRSGSDEVPAIMVSPAAATAAPELADDLLRDAGAIIIVNEGGAGARVEIRFAELRDAQRLHKTLIQSRATAAPVEQSDSLLAKITQIADIGSAEEFGDAIERLRAIRKLIATANEEAR